MQREIRLLCKCWARTVSKWINTEIYLRSDSPYDELFWFFQVFFKSNISKTSIKIRAAQWPVDVILRLCLVYLVDKYLKNILKNMLPPLLLRDKIQFSQTHRYFLSTNINKSGFSISKKKCFGSLFLCAHLKKSALE